MTGLDRPAGGGAIKETALLEAVRAGSPEALARLYAQHSEDVYRLAFRLTESAPDAMDILQDVFIALPEALHGYDGRGPFGGWLRTMVSRTALMKLRSRRRRAEVPLGSIGERLRGREDEPVVDRLSLERAIGALPDSLRVAFVLHEIEGFAHAEIGRLLGIDIGASEVRLHRARRMLRRLLRSST